MLRTYISVPKYSKTVKIPRKGVKSRITMAIRIIVVLYEMKCQAYIVYTRVSMITTFSEFNYTN